MARYYGNRFRGPGWYFYVYQHGRNKRVLLGPFPGYGYAVNSARSYLSSGEVFWHG